MAKLKEEHKVFIVQSLACFKAPSEVVDAVKLDFEVTVTRQQVTAYDPTTVNGARLSAELKDLFARTREEFIRETTAHGIAHQAYRIAELHDMAKRAKARA